MKNSFVVIPFPFSDQVTLKTRPALCLTDPIGPFEEIILAYVTTQIPVAHLDSDVIIDLQEAHKALLLHKSVIRLHKLVSLPKSEIVGALGGLPEKKVIEVKNKLKRLFLN